MKRRLMKNIRCMVSMLAVLIMLGGFLSELPVGVFAAEGPVIKLHYHRPDGSYADWDAWMWEYGKDGAAYAFEDEGGDKVATMEVSAGVTKVGFIVRTAAWTKDVGEDQFIEIPEVVSGTVHIYVESGVKGYSKTYGDDAKVGIKIKSAVYGMSGVLTVEMTAPLEGEADSLFTLYGAEGEIAAEITENGDGLHFDLRPAEELDIYGGNYTVMYDSNSYAVTMPIVFSTDEFESAYTYAGDDLGSVWSTEETAFKVWAPTASEVYVNLYESGNEEENDLIKSVQMTKDVCGTWTAKVKGDLSGTYYTYAVNVGGEEIEACDPYARTTGVNGARAMVIDLKSTDPAGWEADKDPNAGAAITDAVIYEGHIRDLTVNPEGNISKRGKYLGLTEKGTKTSGGKATGVDHLKELGITHLHILPMYDFGSVDETSPINRYNWGYDPVNYNVPEGSYATDPYNGEVRVKEVKEMVKALHESGISVVMDVVYNHVFSAKDFCFNRIVPGYFSRITEGVYSNGSGCGNDTASERSMVRKYIVDSVNYWADEYHIDGFRFDLVGLIDVDTINEIVETVHEKHPNVIFYGEGWTMTTVATKPDVVMATQVNSALTLGFAYFNDTVRDALKGSVFNKAAGFVSGAAGMESKLDRCFIGRDTWCASPAQTINYASCHDNNTLYDRIRIAVPDADEATAVRMNNLAAAYYLTAEGIPFMSAGEELLRSKPNKNGSYNDNSYNAGDTINTIKWATLDDPTYAKVYDYYKGLIAFRKAHPVLRLADAAEVDKYVSAIDGIKNHATGYMIKGGPSEETAEEMVILFNADKEPLTYTLPAGEWKVFVDADKAGCEVLRTVSGEISIEPLSAMVAAKISAAAPSDTGSSGSDGSSADNSAAPDQTTPNSGTDASKPEKSSLKNNLIKGGIGIAILIVVIQLGLRSKKKRKNNLKR